jgi:hypothetical protein
VQLHSFLTSDLGGAERSALHSGRFTAGERDPSIHRIRGWMGPRTGLDNWDKIKIPFPCREYKQIYRFSSTHPSHCTAYSLTAGGFPCWQGMPSFYGNIILVTMIKNVRHSTLSETIHSTDAYYFPTTRLTL